MSESSLQLIAFILVVLIAVLFLMAKRMDEMDADEHEDVRMIIKFEVKE